MKSTLSVVFVGFIVMTSAVAQTPVVPPGFGVRLVATVPQLSSNQTARALAVAPSTFGPFGGHVFIGDLGHPAYATDGGILRVDPTTGVTSTFVYSSTLGDPARMRFGPGGVFGENLYVSARQDPASSGFGTGLISTVDSAGVITPIGNPTPATTVTTADYAGGSVGCAFSFGGARPLGIYSGCNAGFLGDALSVLPPGPSSAPAALILQITGPCSPSPGCDYTGSPSDLELDPSGDLVFGLQSSAPPNSWLTGIYRLTPGGAMQMIVNSTHPLIDNVSDVKIGPGGAFGTQYYVSNSNPAGVMIVDTAGNVTPFLSGFSARIAFGGAGVLYAFNTTTRQLWAIEPCPNPATSNVYGVGFPGLGGAIPSIGVSAPPRIGSALSLVFGNTAAATTAAFWALGASSTNLPTDVGGTILVDQPSVQVIANFSPLGATVPVAIPADVNLCGVSVYLQHVCIDPAAAYGFSFSPGLQLTFGF